MHYARILLLEDEPDWVNTLTHLLEGSGAVVFSAPTPSAAESILDQRYINVALVDVSMQLGDPRNSEGMAFLETIHNKGLREIVQPIIVSGYPDVARMRRAFHDYHVVDFLEKAPFRPDLVREAVREALRRIDLCGPLEVEIEGNRSLSDLLQQFHWSEREDLGELEVEFRDMLRRLFPGADHLFIHPMQAGQSGAGVLEVEPTYPDGVGAACIVKFGKKDKIQRESSNYEEFVKNFAGAQSSTQLSAVCQRRMGAIRYQLVGTAMDRVTDFGDYYAQHTVPEITEGLLNNLLHVTCGLWYDNRKQHRRRTDLISLYSEALSIEWDKVEAAIAAVEGKRIRNGQIEFIGLSGIYTEPLAWIKSKEHQYYVNAWHSTTHGDLNQHNILVAEDGQCWLIDFYRTGPGHILRDVVELEATIKLSLTPLPDLEVYHQLERALLLATDSDKVALPDPSDPLYKVLAVIVYLRRFAESLSGRNRDLREYNVALLMQALKMLSLDFLRADHEKILLSAAMLCSWLENGGKARMPASGATSTAPSGSPATPGPTQGASSFPSPQADNDDLPLTEEDMATLRSLFD